ncbi:hypothetical protein BDR04DRAFT_1231252 [Suillus decipiens]|nr:hypothetical protein BDR04DRAFT_1231252 [Suillus decipiens]
MSPEKHPPPIASRNSNELIISPVENSGNVTTYCTPTSGSGQRIEGRDTNYCLLHLTNPKECPNAPPSVCNEACKALLQKGVAIGLTEAPLFRDSDTPASDVTPIDQSNDGTSAIIKKHTPGGIQGVKRCNLTVRTFETLGKLHSNSSYHVHQHALAAGQPVRRKHAHMHTWNNGGIDTGLVMDLNTNYDRLEGPESLTEDEVAAAFDEIEQRIAKFPSAIDLQVKTMSSRWDLT